MDIERLNKRVTFQKNIVVTDEIGNHLNEWKDYYTCFATISGESGSEEREAGQVVYDESLSVTVRHCKASSVITATDYRVVVDGIIYDITGVDHFSYKHKAIKFKCRRTAR